MRDKVIDYERRIAGFLAFLAIFWWLPAIAAIILGLAYDSPILAAFMIFGFFVNVGWILRSFNKLKAREKLWFGFWTLSALSGIAGLILFLATENQKNEIHPANWMMLAWWIVTAIVSIMFMIIRVMNQPLVSRDGRTANGRQ